MHILVTGGAGFLGSWVVDRLAAAGESVVVLDDLSAGRESALRPSHGNVRFVRGCARDAAVVDRLVAEASQVFHLAAVVGVRESLDQSVRAMRVNTEAATVVFERCAARGVPVLFTSSSEVYGDSEAPHGEDDPLALGSPERIRGGYACSKAHSEWLALGLARERGLRVVVVRLFNVVGPRQSERMVLSRFVRQALAGEPITLHGDGSQRRCFADVEEVARALVELAGTTAAMGRVVNVGSDRECSVRELGAMVRGACGVDVPLREIPLLDVFPSGIEEVHCRRPRLERLTAILGWRPSRSIEEIVARTVAAMRETVAGV
ncbi:MAG: NAD-dependent epimerase/dehydratase family protein [Planctomycetota bacterium]